MGVARAGPMPLPLPLGKQKSYEDRRNAEIQKPAQTEDKWTALRNFRKSKGLCLACGEKLSKDHTCKSSVQLHIVQELIDHLQSEEAVTDHQSDADKSSVYSMHLSAVAVGATSNALTLQLLITLQGMDLVF